LSSAAWQSVALARSQTPSSTEHSNNRHQSPSNPVLAGVKGSGTKERGKGGRLGTFRLGWKWADKEKKEEETKPKKKLIKRKKSKEKREGMENSKTKEVTGNTKDEADENNTRKESSQSSSSIHSNPSMGSTSSTSRKVSKEEKPDTKVRMMKRSPMFWSNKLSKP